MGIECALVARTDAPLRELVQGVRRGKLLKHAQLYAVGDAGTSGAPRVVGTLIYEIRMRRKMDAAVHSFMQRFPDVATLALMPVRPGARTSEAIITVHKASGLRLRLGGAAPPAPYVHFEFFEYGEHETLAKEGSDPKYEQEFRFPVERDGDFTEYLKQAKLRFTLFDEAEEDAEAMLGYCEVCTHAPTRDHGMRTHRPHACTHACTRARCVCACPMSHAAVPRLIPMPVCRWGSRRCSA